MSDEDDTMSIDLSVILAALVDYQGGEVRFPYDSLVKVTECNDYSALAMYLDDDGATIVLSLQEVESNAG